MSNTTTFYYGKSQIRVVVNGQGDPLFVGRDIAAAVGYKEPRDAVQYNVDKEDKCLYPVKTSNGFKDMRVISKSGVYNLIRVSKLKSGQAKQFKHWITSELLPTVCSNNTYEPSDVDVEYEPSDVDVEKVDDTMTPEQRLDFIRRSIDLMERLGEPPEQDKEVYRATIRALTLEVQPQHELQPEQNTQPQQESTEQRYWQVRDILGEMGYPLDDQLMKDVGKKASIKYQQHYGSAPPEVIFRKRNGEKYKKKLYTEKDLPMVKSCIPEAIDEQNNALEDHGLVAAIEYANEQNKQNGNH